MPVDVRSLSLVVLTVLASIFALQWAKAVIVPVLLGVMFSYALTPIVDALQRWRVPRAIGAGAVLSAIVAPARLGRLALSDDASALIETLPQVAQKVRQGVEGRQSNKASASPIEKVQQAANELEQAAQQAAQASAASTRGIGVRLGASPPEQRLGTTTTTTTTTTRSSAPRPAVDARPSPTSSSSAPHSTCATTSGRGTVGLFAFLGQTLVVLLVTLFLLASGDTFRRKMVKLAGPRLSQKKITVQALDEVSMQIQRYLLVQLATSVVVGVATGLAFYLLGLNNAATWGVAAGITNLVPYVGAVLVGVGSAVVGFIQFDSIDKALLIGAQLVRDPCHRRQPAHAVVDRTRQPHEPVRGLRRRARVRLAVGRRRPDPRHADPDGRQGRVRPRRRAQARRRIPRRMTRRVASR